MTNETGYREQLRAVLLAAIMVVSVFGASVAFTGAASAQSGSITAFDAQVTSDGSVDGSGESVVVEGVTTSGASNAKMVLVQQNGTDGSVLGVTSIGSDVSDSNVVVNINSQGGDGDLNTSNVNATLVNTGTTITEGETYAGQVDTSNELGNTGAVPIFGFSGNADFAQYQQPTAADGGGFFTDGSATERLVLGTTVATGDAAGVTGNINNLRVQVDYGAGSNTTVTRDNQPDGTAYSPDGTNIDSSNASIVVDGADQLAQGDIAFVSFVNGDTGNVIGQSSGGTEGVDSTAKVQTGTSASTVDAASLGPTQVDTVGSPTDVTVGQSSASQTISNIQVSGTSLGESAVIEFDYSISQSLSGVGAGLSTTLSGVPANTDFGSTASSGGFSGAASNNIDITANVNSGENSFTINDVQISNIDTQGAVTDNSRVNQIDISAFSQTGGTNNYQTNAYSTVGSSSGGSLTSPADYQDPNGNTITGGVIFAGQNAYLLNPGASTGTTANLRVVDSFSDNVVESSTQVEQLEVEDFSSRFGANAVEIDTEDLDNGFYFIGGTGLSNVPNNPSETGATFEVTTQTLDATLADDDQPALADNFADSQVELDVASGRQTYAMNVSADGDLDNEELFNIFTLKGFDGLKLSAAGAYTPVQNSQTTGPLYWNVTNDGGLEAYDDSGTIAKFQNGDDVAFDSPYAALENATSFSGTNFAPFTGIGSLSDIEATHDGNNVSLPSQLINTNNPFNVGLYAEDQDSDEADWDEKIVLNTVGDIDEQDIAAAGTDEGTYDIRFSATDTTGADSASLEVEEQDLDASFEEGTTEDSVGDIATFNLSLSDTGETYVQIGGESADFAEVLYLDADDASEPMQVSFNTRLLGTSASTSQVYDTSNVDTIESEVHGDITNMPSTATGELYEDDGALSVGSGATDFTAYLEAMDILDDGTTEDEQDQLTRPLQSTDYEITVGGDTSTEDYVFDADNGGEANNELASKSLQLTQPEITGITTHTAPEASADDTDDVSELVDAATERETIAVDDRLVVQVEATGIYGSLVAGPQGTALSDLNVDYDRLTDGVSTQVMYDLTENTDEQITFEVVADATTGNQDPLEVDLQSGDSDSYIVLDEENEQFFLIVDTSSDSAFANGDAPEEATDFTVDMEYDADNEDNRFEFNNVNSPGTASDPFGTRGSTYQNYPYLPQGETISASSQLTLEPREINFDNLNEEDVIQAENVEDAEISGTTNVAPGTDASIRVSSTDASSSFRIGNNLNITDDGSVSTQFDLSGQEVGDEFDTNFRVEGASISTTDSVVVEEGTLSTSEPADDEEEEPADDGEEEEPADDGEEEEPADDGEEQETDDGESESTDDGTPGFGAVVALIALIGAALLAVRRQN